MKNDDPTNTERQRRYRERIKAKLAGLEQPPAPPPKAPRKKARPQRIAGVLLELHALLDEYTGWREGIPANLREGEQAQRLDETLDQIQTAIDALEAIEAPRIGR